MGEIDFPKSMHDEMLDSMRYQRAILVVPVNRARALTKQESLSFYMKEM